ncbi:GD10718 [Drosophila simulans]|uniref:GD10718 n=1 Tax=Drosophila simulans TaxID=7240 RepID=B4QI96_DROSI|nr:GD10718 [Drosophila simulans]
MVEQSNGIFTYRDASGSIQLQRLETVPSGVTLLMYCSPTDFKETMCQDNGQFSVPLPMHCLSPMQPVPKDIRDGDCAGNLYAVGYTIDGKDLELYRTCFDSGQGRLLYSQSDVYYKTFLYGVLVPKRPFVEFVADEMFSPQEAAAYMKSNIYFAFKCIYGDDQSYLPSANYLVINRGHMVASADFLFTDQMGSTFRYLNVVPQFKSINDGNWEKIERWVRSQIPNSSYFRVKSGGIGILTLPDTKGFLQSAFLAGSKIPVPEWTYKVVRDATGNGLYVFLTYNSTFQRERPQCLAICYPVNCPIALPNNPDDGFTFCCDPKRFPY